ncbi:hypothetical protein C1X05_04210 [Laceyella sacchari]|uniref:Uncharacterized protein n=1 Tax=Laceyella tengchongensis TaxID=574699 RepID=A0AA46AD57_9BACL|nr:hypothetical protein C1X05_04210 [Laceyella sacchari]SMP02684.1 hypothetical protein SAMN06265361_101370 [Laceyella tengchongensis]
MSQKWKQPERPIFIEIKGSDVFMTDRRYIIRKEQALEIIQKLLEFYELDDVDEIISQHNLVLDFSYDGFDFSNRYNRHGSLVYHYTEFGLDRKEEWSFKNVTGAIKRCPVKKKPDIIGSLLFRI